MSIGKVFMFDFQNKHKKFKLKKNFAATKYKSNVIMTYCATADYFISSVNCSSDQITCKVFLSITLHMAAFYSAVNTRLTAELPCSIILLSKTYNLLVLHSYIQ
jgi:hypothetical protein